MSSLPLPSNTTVSAPALMHTNPPQNNTNTSDNPKPNHKYNKYIYKHKSKNKNKKEKKKEEKNTTPPRKQNKTTSKPFHQFPFLPTEIRLQIWSKIQQQQNNTKEAHILHINYDTKGRGRSQLKKTLQLEVDNPNSNHGEWKMNHIQNPPVSLSICQESRSLSLPYFKSNYGVIRLLTRGKDDATTQAQASWFDFSKDVIFLNTNGQIYEEGSRRRQPPRGCPINLDRVRHFAIAEDLFYWPFDQAWSMINSQWDFFTSVFNAFKVVEDVKVVRDGWQTDLIRDLQIRFKDVGQDWDVEDGGGAEYNIGGRWMRWWARTLCKELVVSKVEIEDRKRDEWIAAKNLQVLQLLPFALGR